MVAPNVGEAEAPETICERGTAVGFVDGSENATVGGLETGAAVELPGGAAAEPLDLEADGEAAAEEPEAWRG